MKLRQRLIFVCRVTFRSPENQAILDILIKEVKGLSTNFLTQHIRGKSICFDELDDELDEYCLIAMLFHGFISPFV